MKNFETIYLLFIEKRSTSKMDELTKKKISKTLQGRKRSATTINRIRQALKGRKLSDKHKQHISEAMKRKRQSRHRQ